MLEILILWYYYTNVYFMNYELYIMIVADYSKSLFFIFIFILFI